MLVKINVKGLQIAREQWIYFIGGNCIYKRCVDSTNLYRKWRGYKRSLAEWMNKCFYKRTCNISFLTILITFQIKINHNFYIFVRFWTSTEKSGLSFIRLEVAGKASYFFNIACLWPRSRSSSGKRQHILNTNNYHTSWSMYFIAPETHYFEYVRATAVAC